MSGVNLEKLGMPAHAKRVFEGEIWDIWQWEQELFDGSKATFEAGARKPAGVAIATMGNKIAISYEDQPGRLGMINLPGGCADTWDETPLEVAKRELLEETGLASDDWSEFEKVEMRGKTRWDICFYIARNCQKKREPNPGNGEKVRVKIIDLDELIEIASDPKFRNLSLVPLMVEAKYNPEKKEELRKKIFGK